MHQGIFTIHRAGNFSHQPFYLPHQPFGNCQCPTSVYLFSYGPSLMRKTYNHVIYEAFDTVSLWGWASHSSLPWGASFLDPATRLVT